MAPVRIVSPKNFTNFDLATLDFSVFTLSFSFFSTNIVIFSITRFPAFSDPTNMLQSSAKRQNSRFLFSSSLSSSSRTILLSSGLNGLP